MARSRSFYTRDEFNQLCLSMGYDPKDVYSIRISRRNMRVIFGDGPALRIGAHEVRKNG